MDGARETQDPELTGLGMALNWKMMKSHVDNQDQPIRS
jgi:hypothetical protein